jgi:hypothetical protein
LKITFLRRRHQQWTTLWNANTDVDVKDARHKSHKELVKELLRWEEMMDGSEKVEIDGKAYSVGCSLLFSLSLSCRLAPRSPLETPPLATS